MEQQLRQHYERQDTEELLEIAKKDLTDEARTVLISVLATRGVSVAQAEIAQQHGEVARQQAQESESRLGSRFKRLVAFSIDVWGVFLLLWVALYPLSFVSPKLYSNALGLLWFSYFLLRDSIPGQSLGKRLLNLRAIQVGSGKSCTWLKSVGRNLPHLIFVIDAVFALGARRMRLGDMIAETVVIRTERDAAKASA